MNVLIIGATSGIGHRLWQYYSSQGDNVAVMGRRKELLDKMLETSPDHTISSVCDIADINCFRVEFDKICESCNTLDLVIVCASIGELNHELDTDIELSTIRVNVDGWTNCVDTVYNRFRQQGCGHLVTVTSVGGLQSAPDAPAYSASKAFQINYTKSLQRKARRSGIVITEIRPGFVNTRMAKGSGLFWVMPVDKIAHLIVKAIEKKKKCAIITRRWRMINFLLKHSM